MKLLALDVGERRVGIAASDPSGAIASPVGVIRRKSKAEDFAKIEHLIKERGIEGLIIGHPLNDDGSAGPQARRIERYAEALQEALRSAGVQIAVELWDEHMSTMRAQALMIEAGRRARHRRQRIDAAAAAVILQDYLDEHPCPLE